MNKNTKWFVCVLVFFIAAGAVWYAADIWMGNDSVIDKELDFKEIFREAEMLSEKGGSIDATRIAPDIARKRILKHFPVGTDLSELIDYLKNTGFHCIYSELPRAGWGGAQHYCEKSVPYKGSFVNVIWKITIVSQENSELKDVKIWSSIEGL